MVLDKLSNSFFRFFIFLVFLFLSYIFLGNASLVSATSLPVGDNFVTLGYSRYSFNRVLTINMGNGQKSVFFSLVAKNNTDDNITYVFYRLNEDSASLEFLFSFGYSGILDQIGAELPCVEDYDFDPNNDIGGGCSFIQLVNVNGVPRPQIVFLYYNNGLFLRKDTPASSFDSICKRYGGEYVNFGNGGPLVFGNSKYFVSYVECYNASHNHYEIQTFYVNTTNNNLLYFLRYNTINGKFIEYNRFSNNISGQFEQGQHNVTQLNQNLALFKINLNFFEFQGKYCYFSEGQRNQSSRERAYTMYCLVISQGPDGTSSSLQVPLDTGGKSIDLNKDETNFPGVIFLGNIPAHSAIYFEGSLYVLFWAFHWIDDRGASTRAGNQHDTRVNWRKYQYRLYKITPMADGKNSVSLLTGLITEDVLAIHGFSIIGNELYFSISRISTTGHNNNKCNFENNQDYGILWYKILANGSLEKQNYSAYCQTPNSNNLPAASVPYFIVYQLLSSDGKSVVYVMGSRYVTSYYGKNGLMPNNSNKYGVDPDYTREKVLLPENGSNKILFTRKQITCDIQANTNVMLNLLRQNRITLQIRNGLWIMGGSNDVSNRFRIDGKVEIRNTIQSIDQNYFSDTYVMRNDSETILLSSNLNARSLFVDNIWAGTVGDLRINIYLKDYTNTERYVDCTNNLRAYVPSLAIPQIYPSCITPFRWRISVTTFVADSRDLFRVSVDDVFYKTDFDPNIRRPVRDAIDNNIYFFEANNILEQRVYFFVKIVDEYGRTNVMSNGYPHPFLISSFAQRFNRVSEGGCMNIFYSTQRGDVAIKNAQIGNPNGNHKIFDYIVRNNSVDAVLMVLGANYRTDQDLNRYIENINTKLLNLKNNLGNIVEEITISNNAISLEPKSNIIRLYRPSDISQQNSTVTITYPDTNKELQGGMIIVYCPNCILKINSHSSIVGNNYNQNGNSMVLTYSDSLFETKYVFFANRIEFIGEGSYNLSNNVVNFSSQPSFNLYKGMFIAKDSLTTDYSTTTNVVYGSVYVGSNRIVERLGSQCNRPRCFIYQNPNLAARYPYIHIMYDPILTLRAGEYIGSDPSRYNRSVVGL